MRTYDFVHLAMLALGEGIRGKTKLQKTMYFLGILAGCAEELGYRPHYYGPYSDDVADAVKRLKAVDFITQDTTHFGAVNDAGFEIARHDFRLTDDGRAIAQQKAEADQELWQRIQNAVRRFKAAGDLGYMRMSVAAKTFFILQQEGSNGTPDQISEAAKRLGWNPSPSEVAESSVFLQRLGLVSAS
jgi:hypothetical protein